MDVNLQQDYESLFETSNAGADMDSRPRQKYVRSPYPANVDTKPKISDRPEQAYPSAFSFSQNNKPDTPASNILDLSLPARTPSRTSNSSSPAMNFDVCYVCGQESKTVLAVFAKPNSNCPFFANILTHPKPPNAKPMDSNGKVYACENCFKILMQQWDPERKKPQSNQFREEYQDKTSPNVVKKSEELPNKSFVCYTCGMVAQISAQRFIYAYPEKNGDPYFSFLLNSNPHPGASKLVNGKAAVCSLCFKTLSRQLRVFELSNTPEEKRKYKVLNESENFSVLREHLKSGGQNPEDVKSDCYLCECSSETLVSINSLPVSDMYFPFIRGVPKPPNACDMDNYGRVKVCKQCHESLTYQFELFERTHIPIQQRQYKVNSKLSDRNHFHENPAQSYVVSKDGNDFPVKKTDACSLCERPIPIETACYIETVPQEKNMYFPSIAMLVKPNTRPIDQYGRVFACNQCRLILKNQWEVFESAHVPHAQRQYEIFPPKAEPEYSASFNSDIHNPSAALHIQVSSPDIKLDLTKHPNIEPLLTTVNTLSVTTITSSNASASNSPSMDCKTSKSQSNVEDAIPRISGPLDVPATRPIVLLTPMVCFVCSELNVSGLTYTIKSIPTAPVGVDKLPEEVPFFPFLTKHTPPTGEKLKNDSTALVCMFCYYSLMSQWLAYESSPYSEDKNRWHRRYNTHNYVCYICGITTYRKRVCTISVKDFPFLLEHLRPPGALTVLNGECVVTCQTCFESITSQWKDFERMKVPVEMRKYNWIVLPPPPDDENSRGCQILNPENPGSSLPLAENNEQILAEESGIPSGLKPPPPHLTVPSAYGLTKPVGRNVISPVHQSTHSNAAFSPFGNNVNPALNATRTSSFAAALRKLAKQAVDPVADKELSPISPASSPASSQQSSHSRHHAPLPVYLNSHSSNPSGHRLSPPVVTVTPLQSSGGKALDLGRYSSNSRNGSIPEPVSLKIENSKLSNSGLDKRNEISDSKHLSSSQERISLRHEHSVPSRGFQPYRNSEEHHSTPPQMYNPSPPPTTMSSYAYHPSYSQSSQMPHQSYRLEESVYMERYGLLRPSAMPYQSSSNMLTHPRAPLYPTSHYPPELIPQSMRHTPTSSSVYPSRYPMEEETVESSRLKKHEMEAYRDHERYIERKEEREYREREMEYMRKERHLRQSPILHSHPSSRTDLPPEDKGHMGSITHGTPRDYMRRITPPPVSVPLNLATSVINAENELAMEEEMNSKMMKYRNKGVVNGQVHHRSGNHPSAMGYRKESDAGSYKVSYQINSESHSKPAVTMSSSESAVISNPTKTMPSYYAERDFQKSEQVETRTLSMASVINSQINGIFAREKFVSNNSYDYLNSFCDKNIFSDTPPKVKNETKSAHSASENYMSHSKVMSNKAPVQESSKFDSPGNKLPSFLLSDPTYNTSNSNNYPPLLKAQEPSITRALLQNSVAMSYENEMHPFEEPMPKVSSVLDKREERLRNLRKTGEIVDSDYSDPDSDEEDTEKLQVLLKITKGPHPQKCFKLDPKQVQFLSSFGLTTHAKKEIIELKKAIRRHQVLREKSCSPINEEPIKPIIIEYDPKHLSELAKRLCLEENFEAKVEFLKMLGLMFYTPEQKAEREKVMKVVENERLRRNGILEPSQRCIELQGTHLGKRASISENSPNDLEPKKAKIVVKSENTNEEEPAPSNKFAAKKNPAPLKPYKPLTNSVPRLSAFLKPPLRSANLPVPPLIPASQVIPSVTEPIREASASMVAPKDPRVRQLKEFAQEFHNSVLQTTQMQLAEKKQLPSSVHLEVPAFHKSPPASESVEPFSNESRSAVSTFRWPGIEAIMESYECHISEQNVEKTFLLSNCQKLKTCIQESNVEIECLGLKTEELKHEQTCLEVEKKELQSKIEALGLFIQHFR